MIRRSKEIIYDFESVLSALRDCSYLATADKIESYISSFEAHGNASILALYLSRLTPNELEELRGVTDLDEVDVDHIYLWTEW